MNEILTVPAAFSDRIIVKIWRAFRAEYVSFNSRENFASYLEDKLNEAEERYSIQNSDGNTATWLRHVPSPQTFYNFYKSGLADLNGNSMTDPQANISASLQTLKIVYVFLVYLSLSCLYMSFLTLYIFLDNFAGVDH